MLISFPYMFTLEEVFSFIVQLGCVLILILPVVVIGLLFYLPYRRKKNLKNHGHRGELHVKHVAGTKRVLRINNNATFYMKLQGDIHIEGITPYEVTATAPFNPLQLQYLQPGTTFPVFVNKKNLNDVLVITNL